jgi:hypothetical protein
MMFLLFGSFMRSVRRSVVAAVLAVLEILFAGWRGVVRTRPSACGPREGCE